MFRVYKKRVQIAQSSHIEILWIDPTEFVQRRSFLCAQRSVRINWFEVKNSFFPDLGVFCVLPHVMSLN